MNKTAIRNYAVWARTVLIEAVTQKAFEYEIKEGQEMVVSLDSIDGRLLSANEKEWRRNLIDEIKRKSFTQVMEEVAYTWFNRFIALRYMEVNGFIPSRVRVFTNENGEFKPDILKEAMTVEIEGIDRAKVIDLLEKQNNEELFKYLIITQCNALNQGLPYMFEKISNWTELLFPANLLRSDSIIGRMVNEIPEEDWQDAVQIIGWMYQYYNTELKDDTFAKLKKNIKITKERIPAATQLFTPEWIVKYMVENSLGKLWIEGHPDANLKANWKYYLDEAEQEPAVEAELQKIRSEYANIKPEDIKIIDPCMGSGHILVYAFDVLMQIYIAAGYSERDAAKSILENNIYGLDIDDRAGQLAYFAVMMKARKYSRRILNSGITPNVFSIQDSSFMSDDFIAFVANKDHELELDLIGIRNAFVDAKEYGSILSVPKFDYEKLYSRIDELKTYFPQSIFEIEYRELGIEKLYQLVKQAEMLHQKYDVVVTNPPYAGRRHLNGPICDYLDKNYPEGKMDLFAAFILRNISMTKSNGFTGFMTPFVWLYLSSYTQLRNRVLNNTSVTSYIQPEETSFKDAAVSLCSFVLRKWSSNYCAKYVRFNDVTDMDEQAAILREISKGKNTPYEFPTNQKVFSSYPDQRMIYWEGEAFQKTFTTGKKLDEVCQPRQGMATTNNDLFLRLWYETKFSRIGFGYRNEDEAEASGLKWFPYNKGGGFRKWYGNNEYVVNYEYRGKTICDYIDNTPGARVGSNGRVINRQFFFNRSITWSDICGNNFAARSCPNGFIFDVKGSSAFVDPHLYDYIVAFLNTKVNVALLNGLNPSITTQVGDLKQLPFIYNESKCQTISECVESAISLSKEDWDSVETSWDFKKHPLI